MPLTDDIALLREFAGQNSEEAFAELVARHVGLVHSAALRQTGNPHAAEEITQAVFIILARKAGSLSDKVVLSGWLYQTARLTAANYLRAEIRRARREQEAHMQSIVNETAGETETWQHIAPLLEAAMGSLSDADRNAIVLRYFENRGMDEIAATLNAPEANVRKRVTRAVERLRKFFSKKGVALSATTLAGAISAHSVQAAPAGLATTVSSGAAAKGSAAAGSATLTLVKGVLTLMEWTKWKPAIIAGVLALSAGGGTVIVNQALAQTSPPEQYIRATFQNAFSKERFAELKANVWPAEKAAEEERIKSRQKKDETKNAHTIDLKPYINTALTESAASPIGVDGDDLAELPTGTNIYAGVPFDVQGSIQLMGHGMDRYRKTYPEKVSGIVVNHRAAKLHVLQGSNWTYPSAYGTTVAKLVLHYEDGSTRDIDMIAGDHMFDWWSPLFKTGIPPRYYKMGPTTERAWSGSNPFIKSVWPGESVVLYKSTFTNPQPDVTISNIDFVSSMKLTAPFVVAITVE
jgi:RNA polymerase sigma factor (sigma-70 family)